jgi:hypothetical protein
MITTDFYFGILLFSLLAFTFLFIGLTCEMVRNATSQARTSQARSSQVKPGQTSLNQVQKERNL